MNDNTHKFTEILKCMDDAKLDEFVERCDAHTKMIEESNEMSDGCNEHLDERIKMSDKLDQELQCLRSEFEEAKKEISQQVLEMERDLNDIRAVLEEMQTTESRSMLCSVQARLHS